MDEVIKRVERFVELLERGSVVYAMDQRLHPADLRELISLARSNRSMVTVFASCPPHQWAHATTCGYFECIRCREKINYDDPRYNAMAGLDRIKDQSHD